MDTIRAAVIGCGAFARTQHFPNIERSDAIELVAGCSRSEENRAWVEEHYSPRYTTPDAEAVFADADVDLVILSVPHSVHFELMLGAIEAGKHVLAEKPMTMTQEESYRVVKAVKDAGVKLCVDYNRRFAPSIVYMREAYRAHRADPSVGAGQFVEAADRPRLPEEDATMLMIRINDESSTYRPVHIDWLTGGGQVIGETCHWLDLACWLLDEEPTRVFATGSSRLNHIVTLDFSSGAHACIWFSVTGTFRYPKELYELTDHNALFRNLCFVETQVFGRGEPEVRQFDLQYDELPEVGVEGGLEGYVAKLNVRARAHADSGGAQWPNLSPDKGHFQLLEAFARAIGEDGPSPIDERSGARATYLSLRAIESIRLGRPVPVRAEDMCFFVD
ncbi:MAG: Gfo/Idh/MocA family oxidoreductase [Armatimonadota bacterium]|nr:Gfo/Idh/MocA family oxidoreductase [Armatimonadota bacterium]